MAKKPSADKSGADEPNPTRNERVISARIDMRSRANAELMAAFDKFLEDRSLEQANVIRALAKYLVRMETEKRHEVIRDVLEERVDSKSPLLDDIMAGLSWGEHAFRTSLSWSLEEYTQMAVLARDRNMGPLRQFALYKQSHCWMDLARHLRNKALRLGPSPDPDLKLTYRNSNDWQYENSGHHFDAAIDSLQMALSLGTELLKERDHRIFRYNLACTYSTLAQYLVEKELVHVFSSREDAPSKPDGAGSTRAKLRKSIRSLQATMAAFKQEALSAQEAESQAMAIWDEIGALWHADGTPFEGPLADTIDRYGNASYDQLLNISKSVYPELSGFIYTTAGKDTDLLFLRCDSRRKSDFEGWRKRGDAAAESRLYRAYMSLKDKPNGLHTHQPQPSVAEVKVVTTSPTQAKPSTPASI